MLNKHKILLVDDEQNILNSLQRLLRKEGYEILLASSGKEGIEILKKHSVSLIVSDQRMPQMSGVEFFNKIKDIHPDTIRVILSGYTNVNSILEAINQGRIYKFITKPWNDEELKLTIQRALEQHELISENRKLNQKLEAKNKELKQILEERTKALHEGHRALSIHQEILENIPIGIMGLDESGYLVMVNRKGIELLKQDVLSHIGIEIDTLFPKGIVSVISDAIMSQEAGKVSHLLPDKSMVEIDYFPLTRASGAKGIILILRDNAT